MTLPDQVAATMDAQTFLDQADRGQRQPVFVLHGDDDFLKRRVRQAIVTLVLGDGDADFAVSNYLGERLDFSLVANELDTLAFLAPVRIVVVEQAEQFVSEHRERLERYVASPSKVGVLILEVKTFPETTKLAKALPATAKIACKAPALQKMPEWCVKWAKANYKKKLTADAAEGLIELVGASPGLLDQELAKLAVAVGDGATIEVEQVLALVQRSRAANVFDILNAVGDGKPADAFGILQHLIDEGDNALAILGALTSQLRKLATVNRLVAQGQSLGPALDAAGVAKWPQARQSAERQLKHLGRRRLDQLPDWLVEINLGLKGGNALPPQTQLECLLVRLAGKRAN